MAEVNAWAGDSDAAFYWLEKELEFSGHLNAIGMIVFLVSLHDDPRWSELLEKAGASPEQLAQIKFEAKLPN